MEKNNTGAVRARSRRAKVSITESFLDVLAMLQREAVTAQEIARQTGMSIETVRGLLKKLHQRKMVYINDWEIILNGRIKLPMYRFGAGRDVPRPQRQPNYLVQRRFRAMQKTRQEFDPFFAMCRPML